jgi:hypothetical protein
LVAAVDAAGGKASLEDMNRYQVEWNEPVTGQIQGYKIISRRPPSVRRVLPAYSERKISSRETPLCGGDGAQYGVERSRAQLMMIWNAQPLMLRRIRFNDDRGHLNKRIF